jgi:hypothetical protein
MDRTLRLADGILIEEEVVVATVETFRAGAGPT